MVDSWFKSLASSMLLTKFVGFSRVAVSMPKYMMSAMADLVSADIGYDMLGLAALPIGGCTRSENVVPRLMSIVHETGWWSES